MKTSPYRIDQIFKYLHEYTKVAVTNTTTDPVGLSAAQIADALSLNRTGVSRDLNALHRDMQVIKFLGKPTRFLDQSAITDFTGLHNLPSTVPIGISYTEVITRCRYNTSSSSVPFSEHLLIERAGSSLKYAAMQTEAAIHYPGGGIHILISGPHGMGKRSFAAQIFDYSRACGKLSNDARLFNFDCRSAGRSMQAIRSQLFGSTETNTSPRVRGLVERASDGVLILEEVQFLPAVIQESMISLILYHTYARVGESESERHSNVMLIATCSETPLPLQGNPLLEYFPFHIELPSLSERTPYELFTLIHDVFAGEAAALERTLYVSRDVFLYLMRAAHGIAFVSLNSNIRHICAIALYDEQNTDRLEIRLSHMPHALMRAQQASPGSADYLNFLNQHCADFHEIAPGSVLNLQAPETDDSLPASEETKTLVFVAFHGRGVSTGIAELLESECGIHCVPIPFDGSLTYASALQTVIEEIASTPGVESVLFFIDGMELHTFTAEIQRIENIPVHVYCGLSLDQIYAILRGNALPDDEKV